MPFSLQTTRNLFPCRSIDATGAPVGTRCPRTGRIGTPRALVIELMVVVLIIGILIAIALPTFLGARTRAQNKAAQSDLRNALVAAKTLYTDASSYAGADASTLATVEGSLNFVDGATTLDATDEVSVDPESATVWSAARLSAAGDCFYVADDASTGTTYGQTATGDLTSCTADSDDADATAWT